MDTKKLLLLALTTALNFSCAGKVVPNNSNINVIRVFVTEGTVVNDERRSHIVTVTKKLCDEAGRSGVDSVILDNKDRGIVTLVAYLCVGECSNIADADTCVPGQRRVLEEIVSDKEENHYLTFRMLLESQ